MTIQAAPPDTADQAAPLDALLADAALGTFRRFTPDASAAKFAAGLARRPYPTRPEAGQPGRRTGTDRGWHLHAGVRQG
jgi:hypothetical protein